MILNTYVVVLHHRTRRMNNHVASAPSDMDTLRTDVFTRQLGEFRRPICKEIFENIHVDGQHVMEDEFYGTMSDVWLVTVTIGLQALW